MKTLNYKLPEPFDYFDTAQKVLGIPKVEIRFSPSFLRWEVIDEDRLICYGEDEAEMRDLVDFLNSEVI